MKNRFLKNTLSSRISLGISSVLFIFTLLGIGTLYSFNDSKNKDFVKNIIDEQIGLVFNKLENYRIQAKYQELAKTIYQLELVSEVAIYDKNCNFLVKIPLNRRYPNICKSEKENYLTKVFNDDVFGIYAIAVMPNSDTYQSKNVILIASFLFLILGFSFLLLVSNVFTRKIISKPFKDLNASIKALVDRRDFSKIEKNMALGPNEMKPVYATLLHTTKKLDQAQERLIQKQHFEANHRFGKILVHNVKTPVGLLDSSIDTIEDGKLLSSDVAKNLKGLSQQVKAIVDSLSEHFLTSSASSDNSEEYIAYLIEECVSECQMTKKLNKGIELKINLDEKIYSMKGKVNKTDFKAIIFNMINNSSEAMKNGGLISITASIINNHILIEIKDSGEGISEDKIKELFKEGYTTKDGGNGLGLFHARESIKSWGGYVGISSRLNLGTTVTLSLPIVQTFDAQNDIKEIIISAPQVFLIEDDKFIRGNWNTEAKRKNIKNFIPCSSPEEVLQVIESNPPSGDSLFIIDSHFETSDMSGQELSFALFRRGFKNLYISSAFEKKEFSGLYWIKGILEDKGPFWD